MNSSRLSITNWIIITCYSIVLGSLAFDYIKDFVLFIVDLKFHELTFLMVTKFMLIFSILFVFILDSIYRSWVSNSSLQLALIFLTTGGIIVLFTKSNFASNNIFDLQKGLVIISKVFLWLMIGNIAFSLIMLFKSPKNKKEKRGSVSDYKKYFTVMLFIEAVYALIFWMFSSIATICSFYIVSWAIAIAIFILVFIYFLVLHDERKFNRSKIIFSE